jgi:hypothetical protein
MATRQKKAGMAVAMFRIPFRLNRTIALPWHRTCCRKEYPTSHMPIGCAILYEKWLNPQNAVVPATGS